MKKNGMHLSKMAVAAVALQLLVTGTALAHHPEITASAVCDDYGILVINYTSTSWLTTGEPGSGNPQIDILINNTEVDQGAYASPSFSFSGTAPAPAGTSATVAALAVGTWDNGYEGGQSTAVTVVYPTVPCVQPAYGRFTGGGHQIRVDQVRVTRGLTIHCDLLLSNNLEINWQGNQFHMTEHLSTAQCSDDPLIVQAPPVAPLDTLIGVGTGRYNGMDGFTIEFTLVDAGEPGSLDQAAFRVFETGNPGNVVLNVPLQVLTGGNLQAHYDQPHK